MTNGHANPKVDEFDHRNTDFTEPQVRAVWNDMREQCPVFHSPRYGGFDVLTRHRDVRAALNDPETYSSADGVGIPSRGTVRVPALEFDEPDHSRWRTILGDPLAPRAVKDFEPVITDTVDHLIDRFAAVGHADLVHDLAEPLPALVIGRMVGLDPQPAIELRVIADELFAAIGTEAFAEKKSAFDAYTRRCLEERRNNPRDDVLTQMAHGVVNGEPIDEAGIDGMMLAYFIGGHHSTGSALAGLFAHVLSDDPAVREAVRDDRRTLLRAIEESLRLTTPLQHFGRTTRCPVEVDGEPIPAGRRVMLSLAAANRDPREFDRPDEFRLDRARNRHVAFGGGAHVCQGQHLARAELRITVERLLTRLPDIGISGPIVRSGLIGGSLLSTRSIPVAFTPTQDDPA